MVLATFFVLPLMLVVVVSFWDYTEYSLIPDLILMNYAELFYGCFDWDRRVFAQPSPPISRHLSMSFDMVLDARHRFRGGTLSGLLCPLEV